MSNSGENVEVVVTKVEIVRIGRIRLIATIV